MNSSVFLHALISDLVWGGKVIEKLTIFLKLNSVLVFFSVETV